MRRQLLRRGEYLAVAGALGLLLTLFLDWFDTPGPALVVPAPRAQALEYAGIEIERSGFQTVGWVAAGLAVLAIAAGLFWIFALLAPDTPRLPFKPDVVTLVLAELAAGALVARLVFQPGLGAGLDDKQVDVLPAAYLGVACALVLAAGAWLAISDAPASRET